MPGENRPVDVAIVTFDADLFRTLLARIPPTEEVDGERAVYHRGELKLNGGGSYTVAIARVIETGDGDTDRITRDLLEACAPRLLVLVATVRAKKSTLAPGDVVLPVAHLLPESRSHWGNREGGPPPFRRPRRPVHPTVTKWIANLPAIEARMAAWDDPAVFISGDSEEDQVGRTLLAEKAPPRVEYGIVAIEDVDSAGLGDPLLPEPAIVAVEIHTENIYRAAETANVPVLTVDGVASAVGGRSYETLARATAIAFTLAFLRTCPIPSQHAAPSPRPSPPSLARPRPFSQERFLWEHLSLSNFRGFERLDLTLRPPSQEGAGQWLVLLGDNGVGKTSILRALALALSPEEVAHAVLGSSGAASPSVRAGSAEATVEVRSADGALLERRIVSTGFAERLEEGPRNETPLPFVVAYGCRRGSALGVNGKDFSALGAVRTLFEEGVGLISAEGWLQGWKLAALQGEKGSNDALFFDAVIDTLIALLPGVKVIHVARERVEVEFEDREIGRVRLGALSDGYLTTAGWVIDMIARWVEEASRHDLDVDANFAQRMTGVAIIDEVDLHLHPRWQRDVLASVRKAFKKMSFVVTTHNPLTLLGAEAGEIQVLRRDASGRIDVVQRDLPKGTGAERILTGDWFGLVSTLDDDTLALLEEHRELLRSDLRDEAKVQAVEAELRSRLGAFAETSVERLAHDAAAQVIDEDIRTLTPEAKESARREIAALLRKPAPKKARKPRAPRAAE